MAYVGAEIAFMRSRLYEGKRNMCDRCDETDKEIKHYEELAKATTDKRVLDAIDGIVAALEGFKSTLHPKH